MLKQSKVWLAATGQIFFTLSVGFGAIHTYASYLKEKDDVVLSGLATCSTNEFCEVILGGSIAIPVTVAFFGLAQTKVVAAAMLTTGVVVPVATAIGAVPVTSVTVPEPPPELPPETALTTILIAAFDATSMAAVIGRSTPAG
jgi:SNF family Na+-dependent transporter